MSFKPANKDVKVTASGNIEATNRKEILEKYKELLEYIRKQVDRHT